MNKMAKGALAISVGAALLLGGGGTLAVWNDTETAAAGQIAAGELSLTTAKDGEGKWTNLAGSPVDLKTYKVVPGDVLTYTQKLDIKLAGELMAAKLTVAAPVTNSSFKQGDLDIELPTLTKADGTVIDSNTILDKDDSGIVTASAKFTFVDRVGQGTSSTNATAGFEDVTFKLDQVAVGTK